MGIFIVSNLFYDKIINGNFSRVAMCFLVLCNMFNIILLLESNLHDSV